MQDPMIDSSAPLSDWFDGSTLCLRRQDKMAIKQLPGILSGPKPYVVVVGPGSKLISHYFESIYRGVKAVPDLLVDVFLPATADGLLARFNDVLAEFSVADARQPPSANTQRRILMLSESVDLGQREWDLLARLLSDFPAANFGLLVFVDEPENALVKGFIQSMGSKLHQCSLNFPNAQELQALLESAQDLEQKTQVVNTLRQLGVNVSEPRDSNTKAGQEKTASSNVDANTQSETETEKSTETKHFTQTAKLLLGLFVAFAVAVTVSLALNDELSQGVESPPSAILPAWMPPWVQQAWQGSQAELDEQQLSDFLLEPSFESMAEPIAESAVDSIQEYSAESTALPSAELQSKPAPEPAPEPEPVSEPPAGSPLASLFEPAPDLIQSASAVASPDPLPALQVSNQLMIKESALERMQSQALPVPVEAQAETEAEAESIPPAALVPAVPAEFTLDPNAYYLQFMAVELKENAIREQQRLLPVFETRLLRLRTVSSAMFVVLAGPYASLGEATRAKEVGNNVDAIIVRGALLQRRQVPESEPRFE